MNFFHINARIVRRVGFAAATLGIVIASSPMTFAAGPNGPGPNGPGNGGSKFQLTNLTVSALKNSSQTFDLMVTVDQTGADGSSSTKYFHSFPSTLYLTFAPRNHNKVHGSKDRKTRMNTGFLV